ncbi:MAG TPA: hypothetical protein VH120_00455 [Gemmataceae bacterium]|nr:hypothetical protein [Gemmataceae bacterium]
MTAAVRRYCGGEHGGAHRASVDVAASFAVLDAMLGRHPELPRHVDDLHDLLVEVDIGGWLRRDGGAVIFARGKHRDACLDQVAATDPPYLRWLADRVLPDAGRLIRAALENSVI